MGINLKEVFDKFEDDYGRDEDIAVRLSGRPDLNAFMLLDQLQPESADMISASEHDEFFLSIDCEKLAEVITEEQVRDLVRCGVMYSDGYESLTMYS